MSFWDFKRGPARTRLLVDYARAKGFSLAELLKGSGVALAQLDDPNTELLAAQELRIISNLLKLTGAPDQLGIDLGLRYHFSAYGVWGFGLILPSGRSRIARIPVAARHAMSLGRLRITARR
jgi:hypothetical protein